MRKYKCNTCNRLVNHVKSERNTTCARCLRLKREMKKFLLLQSDMNCEVCGKSLNLRVRTPNADTCCKWVVMR